MKFIKKIVVKIDLFTRYVICIVLSVIIKILAVAHTVISKVVRWIIAGSLDRKSLVLVETKDRDK